MTIDAAEFDFLVKFIHEKSGIALGKDKHYLLESRLLSVIRLHNLDSINTLSKTLKTAANANLVNDVIEAMTTNETSFFRDTKPFVYFHDILMPEIMKQNKAPFKVRLWSAACSTGQEAYSLGMYILEKKHEYPGCTFEIIGTDLDRNVVTKANSGLYSQFEVQRGLPIALLLKYFTQEGDQWRVKPELKSFINFQAANLLTYTPIGHFDVVLCRNVLIYFDTETKQKVLQKLISALKKPGGNLVVGSTEAVQGFNEVTTVAGFPGIYKLV
ncbi:MAG: chemotaxis protein CheR [Proteobacteria bacterium]|nr:chemotaxis protein CheR [Pseudomonadota bacterium]